MTSSVIITCTYPFTQIIIIFKSQQYWFQRYVIIHDINSNFSTFVRKNDQEIIWNFCVIRLLYLVSAHNLTIHFISFKESSYVDCQNGPQYTIKASQYILRINPLDVVEINGFRNDAIHEPLPGHQLNLLWQNAVSGLYIFDHQRVNISLGSMLERFHTTIKGGSLWVLKLCEMRVLAI